MASQFKTIGIMGKHRYHDTKDTVLAVIEFLTARQLAIVVDEETARSLSPQSHIQRVPRHQLGAHCDLVVVVGGDGCFLSAARAVTPFQKPLIGINRGWLGFLTDIVPQQITEKLGEVLDGHYYEERRFLLHCDIVDQEKMLADSDAVNEVALLPGDGAHMIEFEVYINHQFVCFHRADGIIVATPTGSTAYALSCGGPILHPQLDALALVPLCSHTLSSRPIVVAGDSHIELVITDNNNPFAPHVSCDGQARIAAPPGSKIKIQKQEKLVRLLHPKSYEFFETLRSKLGWENKPHNPHA